MSNTITWSPTQYLKFADERTRAARDLLGAVGGERRRVVDVGCGPGNSTELLVARFAGAEVSGFDTSETMLAEARCTLPGVKFFTADAATWRPEAGTDLVFANAVYQWIPEHFRVLPEVVERLAPGGALAVQMPDNLDQPSHVLMREVAAAGPFAAKLADAARAPLPPAAVYYDALAPVARRVDIWRTTYTHVLESADAVVEWVKGTGLGPFLKRLTMEEQPVFLADYSAAIRKAYPVAASGKVLLPFPRLFIVAER